MSWYLNIKLNRFPWDWLWNGFTHEIQWMYIQIEMWILRVSWWSKWVTYLFGWREIIFDNVSTKLNYKQRHNVDKRLSWIDIFWTPFIILWNRRYGIFSYARYLYMNEHSKLVWMMKCIIDIESVVNEVLYDNAKTYVVIVGRKSSCVT